jgi:hypothetical protein
MLSRPKFIALSVSMVLLCAIAFAMRWGMWVLLWERFAEPWRR